MLRLTGIERDLVYDQEMYEMIEAGLRGGMTQTTCKKVEANNKYMSFGFYSFIFYLDVWPPFRGPFREASATCMFASARASSKQQLPRASAE